MKIERVLIRQLREPRWKFVRLVEPEECYICGQLNREVWLRYHPVIVCPECEEQRGLVEDERVEDERVEDTRPRQRPMVIFGDPRKVRAWKQIVREMAELERTDMPLMEGPLRLFVEFEMPRPLDHYARRNARKPKLSAPRWHADAS